MSVSLYYVVFSLHYHLNTIFQMENNDLTNNREENILVMLNSSIPIGID